MQAKAVLVIQVNAVLTDAQKGDGRGYRAVVSVCMNLFVRVQELLLAVVY